MSVSATLNCLVVYIVPELNPYKMKSAKYDKRSLHLQTLMIDGTD